MIQLNAKFIGHVHGVGFRATAALFAKKLGLTGYARNVPDGSVEVIAQGEMEKLEQLIDKLKKEFGPSYIHEIKRDYSEVTQIFDSFSIVP